MCECVAVEYSDVGCATRVISYATAVTTAIFHELDDLHNMLPNVANKVGTVLAC